MEDFILRANIEHLQRKLATSEDEAQRGMIIELLHGEIAKLPPDEQDEARRRLTRGEAAKH